MPSLCVGLHGSLVLERYGQFHIYIRPLQTSKFNWHFQVFSLVASYIAALWAHQSVSVIYITHLTSFLQQSWHLRLIFVYSICACSCLPYRWTWPFNCMTETHGHMSARSLMTSSHRSVENNSGTVKSNIIKKNVIYRFWKPLLALQLFIIIRWDNVLSGKSCALYCSA